MKSQIKTDHQMDCGVYLCITCFDVRLNQTRADSGPSGPCGTPEKQSAIGGDSGVTLNSALAPDCRSDSMLPGSRYAMLIRKPGPVKAHSFFRLIQLCSKDTNVSTSKVQPL